MQNIVKIQIFHFASSSRHTNIDSLLLLSLVLARPPLCCARMSSSDRHKENSDNDDDDDVDDYRKKRKRKFNADNDDDVDDNPTPPSSAVVPAANADTAPTAPTPPLEHKEKDKDIGDDDAAPPPPPPPPRQQRERHRDLFRSAPAWRTEAPHDPELEIPVATIPRWEDTGYTNSVFVDFVNFGHICRQRGITSESKELVIMILNKKSPDKNAVVLLRPVVIPPGQFQLNPLLCEFLGVTDGEMIRFRVLSWSSLPPIGCYYCNITMLDLPKGVDRKRTVLEDLSNKQIFGMLERVIANKPVYKDMTVKFRVHDNGAEFVAVIRSLEDTHEPRSTRQRVLFGLIVPGTTFCKYDARIRGCQMLTLDRNDVDTLDRDRDRDRPHSTRPMPPPRTRDRDRDRERPMLVIPSPAAASSRVLADYRLAYPSWSSRP